MRLLKTFTTIITLLFFFNVQGQKTSTNKVIGYWLANKESKIGKNELTLLFRPDMSGTSTDKVNVSTALSGDDCPTVRTMKVDFTYKIKGDSLYITFGKTMTSVLVQSYPANSDDKSACENWRLQRELQQKKIFQEQDYKTYALKYLYLGNVMEFLGDVYKKQ